MARRLRSDNEIDVYVARVIAQANHHATNVNQIVLPLSQSVRTRINLTMDKVEVFERMGHLGRACWITIGRFRWVFSYNYTTAQIELRENSTQGFIMDVFDNGTTQAQIDMTVSYM